MNGHFAAKGGHIFGKGSAVFISQADNPLAQNALRALV
jgi:hypothetical protein